MIRLLWGGLMLFFLTLPALAGNDYSLSDFAKRYQAINNDSEYVELCREFMTNATNIDAIRDAQYNWQQLDPDGVLKFTRQLVASDSTSLLYKYLLGRIMPDKIESIRIGRELIASDPTYPYGYRLVLGTYDGYLLTADPNSHDAAALSHELPQDTSLFNTLVNNISENDWSLKFLYDFQIYMKRYDQALETLNRAELKNYYWTDQMEFPRLASLMGQYQKAYDLVTKEVDKRIKDQGDDPKVRDSRIDNYYRGILTETKAYGEAIRYLSEKNRIKKDKSSAYDLACFYALSGNQDSGLYYLGEAAAWGWDKPQWTRNDSDLVSLHHDPRWDSVVGIIETNRVSGADSLRSAALNDKIDKEAFDWTLSDGSGNTIRLSDLRGKIVVIEFWATWCYFCRAALPVVEQFARKHQGDDIVVIAMQVLEKGRGKAKKYMEDSGYDMTLVFGNDEVTAKYGIEGIPHFCAIDKAGRIRFQEIGYNPRLSDVLEFWFEDLNQ